MSVTSPVTGRVTGIVASGVTRSCGHRTRVTAVPDADALAYIAAVEEADDEALEVSIKSAYEAFVIGCKADGIWDAIKASCILAGARTLAGCLVPLVGAAPTNNGPFVTGDYNRITGLIGNGTTKYLHSNRNNNADPQDDQHLAVYVSESGEHGKIAMGVGGAGIGASLLGTGGGNRSRNSELDTSTSLPEGLFGISRSAGTGFTVRAAGTNYEKTRASQTPSNANVGVFANEVGSGASPGTYSYYSIGESLSLANLDTRVSTLMTAIGEALA